MTEHNLEGAGGLFGKPKSKTPATIPESGRSVSKGQIIEVLCSGGYYGIEGLGNNPKDNIYLDETPITANGVENFKGIEVYERKGTPFQLPLQDFNSEISSEVSVGVTVAFNNPVTRTFVNDNCAAFRVRLSFVLNQNQKDSSGNVTGTKAALITFKVYLKQGSGGFAELATITQTGKYSEPYEKIWIFNVDPTFDEYSIRIERVTGTDNTDFRRVLRWESYSVIIDSLLSFKRLAYLGIKFNAEDFGQSIPERRYKIKGQILQIPTNATITADRGLDYVGEWDGNFKIPTQTCSDFFAIIWSLLTDPIDGAGIAAQNINRWTLYKISLYNNQYVPDGLGGLERRYLFDFVLNKDGSPYDVLNWVCSGCNARMIEEFGQLTFIQDAPQDIFATLTNADVEKGEFIYSSVDASDIATQVQVTWIDQSKGVTRQEFINDAAQIAIYGKQTKQVEAVGCSRRSQAIRVGRAILYSEAKEIEIVSFKARDFAAYIPVGGVIAIQDSNILNLSLGGLVKSATSTSITFDNLIEIKQINGFNEEFYLSLYSDARQAISNGTYISGYAHYLAIGQGENRLINGYLVYLHDSNLGLHIRAITNSPGNYTTLTFGSLSFTPQTNSPFMVQSPEYSLKRFKIESKEFDGDTVSITAKQFDNFKWDYIERGFSLEPTNTGNVMSITRPNVPLNLKGIVFVLSDRFSIDISWQEPLLSNGLNDFNIKKYFLYYRENAGDTWQVSETVINAFSFQVTRPGLYEFRVIAENILGQQSDYTPTVTLRITTIQAVADYRGTNSSGFAAEF
jgi:predicted phage tail protein